MLPWVSTMMPLHFGDGGVLWVRVGMGCVVAVSPTALVVNEVSSFALEGTTGTVVDEGGWMTEV